MLSLAEFQFTMAADLLDGGMRTARLLPGDPVMVREALRVLRNTVLTGLTNALRLGHPTVAWLTGEDFFDQAAHAFAVRSPAYALPLRLWRRVRGFPGRLCAGRRPALSGRCGAFRPCRGALRKCRFHRAMLAVSGRKNGPRTGRFARHSERGISGRAPPGCLRGAVMRRLPGAARYVASEPETSRFGGARRGHLCGS